MLKCSVAAGGVVQVSRVRVFHKKCGEVADERIKVPLEGSDVCYAPVLPVSEAIDHPHHVARGTFVESGGLKQPGPAPRLSGTPGLIRRPPPHEGQHTDELLDELGLGADEVAALRASGAVA